MQEKGSPAIFADSADMEEIEPLLAAGVVDGVTTNPTLLKRAGAKSAADAKQRLETLLKRLAPRPVSLEITALEEKKMLEEAEGLAALGENAVVKVPVGGYPDPLLGLRVISALAAKNIATNATLVFSTHQALFAARAGAAYVSPFVGRMGDYLINHDEPDEPTGNALYSEAGKRFYNTARVACQGSREEAGARLLQEIRDVFDNHAIKTCVLAASIRHMAQFTEALKAGANAVTVPPRLLLAATVHPLTESGMKVFIEDASSFALQARTDLVTH